MSSEKNQLVLTPILDRQKCAYVTLRGASGKRVVICYSFIDKRTIRYGGAVYTPDPSENESETDNESGSESGAESGAESESDYTKTTSKIGISRFVNRLRETAYQRARVRPIVFKLGTGLNLTDPYIVRELFSKTVGIATPKPNVRARNRLDKEERREARERRRRARLQSFERRMAALLKPTAAPCSAKTAANRAIKAAVAVSSIDISVLVD